LTASSPIIRSIEYCLRVRELESINGLKQNNASNIIWVVLLNEILSILLNRKMEAQEDRKLIILSEI
jgi:hypothetical protein